MYQNHIHALAPASLIAALCLLATNCLRAADNGTPAIVSTSPAGGATDVDPALSEITVTFDRDMGPGFSWTGGGPEFPGSPAGQKAHWRDQRTCVLPVQLEPGRSYRVGINAPSFKNFRSTEGVPAAISEIRFTTKGTPATKPRIVKLVPLNGAKNVDPSLTELRVTFNVEMGGGFSWTGSGPQYPTIPEGKRPYWTEDKKTCVLPVQLQPSWDYRLGLNSPSFRNFKSAAGVSLDPVSYSFKTRN
jgi:Bacterial Ig-like domain